MSAITINDFPSILYVEDDLQSRRIMQLLLVEAMGLPYVTIFEDSTDLLSRVHQLQPQPDIILLDIHVPPHDGFEMLAMLRQTERFADTPIIALTASVMSEEVQKLKQSGFNGVVAKPIDLDTFPDTMNRIARGEQIWRVIA